MTVAAKPRRFVVERSDILHAAVQDAIRRPLGGATNAPISSLDAASLAVAKVLETATAAPVAVIKRAAQ